MEGGILSLAKETKTKYKTYKGKNTKTEEKKHTNLKGIPSARIILAVSKKAKAQKDKKTRRQKGKKTKRQKGKKTKRDKKAKTLGHLQKDKTQKDKTHKNKTQKDKAQKGKYTKRQKQ